MILLKSHVTDHLPLFLNYVHIPEEVTSVKVLRFVFDSSLTWQARINNVLSCGRQRLGQLVILLLINF